MVVYGKEFICNRCGKKAFTSYEADAPAGWLRLSYNNELCPNCTDLYNKMMNNFFAPEVKRNVNFEE